MAENADLAREEIDLCAILGHDPYWDEPTHCGRCDAQIDAQDVPVSDTGTMEP